MASITSKAEHLLMFSIQLHKHITFNKGEYVGFLEPAIEDSVNSDLPSHAQLDTQSTVSPPKE